MSLKVKTAGSWTTVNALSVNIGGTWTPVVQGSVLTGSVWTPFYITGTVAVAPVDRTWDFATISPTNCYTGVQYKTTGDEYYVSSGIFAWTDTGYNWLSSGAAADLHIKCTVNSGTTPSGSATGSWLACTSDIGWYLMEDTNGFAVKACNLTIAFSDDAGSTTLDSCTVILISSVEE